MVKIVVPKYPEALTTKFWDKAKGPLAKVFTKKTGVTEELKKSIALFEALPFNTIPVNGFLEKRKGQGQGVLFPKDVKDLRDEYIKFHQPYFKGMENSLRKLSEFLAGKATELESGVTTKAFAKVLTVMSTEANKFSYAIAFGTIADSNMKDWEVMIGKAQVLEQTWITAKADIKKVIKTARDFVEDSQKKTPTLAVYEKALRDKLRGIGAKIQMANMAKDFEAPMKTAKTIWNDGSLPKKVEDLPARLKKDLDLIGKFEKVANELIA